MMKRAVAYCRVSTDGQLGEDKFGIETQKEQIKKYCDDNDIYITDWFIDEGVSGAEKDRPALGRLLSGEITNPPVQYVVIAKTDRLARDVELYYTFKGMLHSAPLNLEVISVSEDWSKSDELTGMIIENVFAMVGEIERVNIKYRTAGGRKLKAKTGNYAGGRPPYGYRSVNRKFEIVPEEAEIVRFIFKERNEGKTMIEIRDDLNAAGYRTRKGSEFAHSTVQMILNNKKTYQGYYHYGDVDWVKGQHEPILSEDDETPVSQNDFRRQTKEPKKDWVDLRNKD